MPKCDFNILIQKPEVFSCFQWLKIGSQWVKQRSLSLILPLPLSLFLNRNFNISDSRIFLCSGDLIIYYKSKGLFQAYCGKYKISKTAT